MADMAAFLLTFCCFLIIPPLEDVAGSGLSDLSLSAEGERVFLLEDDFEMSSSSLSEPPSS